MYHAYTSVEILSVPEAGDVYALYNLMHYLLLKRVSVAFCDFITRILLFYLNETTVFIEILYNITKWKRYSYFHNKFNSILKRKLVK